MLYLILLCAVVSLASAVIAEDKEPVIENVVGEGSDAGVGNAFVAVAANDSGSLTDSELEDLKGLAA